MTIKKPILAGRIEDLNTIKYSCLCTPKIDGIRALIVNGEAVTRSFKIFPNNYIRNTLRKIAIEGMDGEIVVKGKSFNEISGDVMREDGKPDFVYKVFDICDNPLEPYYSRMEHLSKCPQLPHIEYVLPVIINNETELLAYETKVLSEGYEGVMLRSPGSPYKYGRSTLKESYLLKLKRFVDNEAIILEVYEKMSNQNEAEKDAFGRTKRSTALSGQIPADTLGGFRVKDLKSGIEFGIGSGFDDRLREEVWSHRENYIGKIVKYKSQKIGEKDAPRFPVFLGFRDSKDM